MEVVYGVKCSIVTKTLPWFPNPNHNISHHHHHPAYKLCKIEQISSMASSSIITIRPPSNNTCLIPNNLLNPSSPIAKSNRISFSRRKPPYLLLPLATTPEASLQLMRVANPKTTGLPIMVNGCTGKMGRAVLEAAISAGLRPVPVALGGPQDSGKIIDIDGMQIEVQGDTSEREYALSSMFKDYPDLIVVDYTVPAAVNGNAALYAKVGVPFVMGTTGGDRKLLYKTVADSNIYAVISPQMGKQVVAFLAAMEIMAEQFPGAFSGYKLDVMESHQNSKKDISGTAMAVISSFEKLGADCDFGQIKQIRDPRLQVEMVGVPQEHLLGHAFHLYNLTSPDETVTFEFQHNVCGRSIYAEGTVDAVLFLAKKVQENADNKIYDMIDVLREGNMR